MSTKIHRTLIWNPPRFEKWPHIRYLSFAEAVWQFRGSNERQRATRKNLLCARRPKSVHFASQYNFLRWLPFGVIFCSSSAWRLMSSPALYWTWTSNERWFVRIDGKACRLGHTSHGLWLITPLVYFLYIISKVCCRCCEKLQNRWSSFCSVCFDGLIFMRTFISRTKFRWCRISASFGEEKSSTFHSQAALNRTCSEKRWLIAHISMNGLHCLCLIRQNLLIGLDSTKLTLG